MFTEITFLLFRLVEFKEFVEKNGWEQFTEKYVEVESVMIDNFAVNINNYFEISAQTDQKTKLLQ